MTEELKLKTKTKQEDIQHCFRCQVNKCGNKPCPCPKSKGKLWWGSHQVLLCLYLTHRFSQSSLTPPGHSALVLNRCWRCFPAWSAVTFFSSRGPSLLKTLPLFFSHLRPFGTRPQAFHDLTLIHSSKSVSCPSSQQTLHTLFNRTAHSHTLRILSLLLSFAFSRVPFTLLFHIKCPIHYYILLASSVH